MMEQELNKKGIDDDILSIVKGFVDYFEQTNEKLQTEEDEADDYRI